MNQVSLIGRITHDVELQKTSTGTSVAKFTLAVNRRFNIDQTDFIRCVAWKNQAEFLNNYIKKGALLGVTGRIETGSYEDKDGKKVYTTEIVVENVQALEPQKQRNQEPTSFSKPQQENNDYSNEAPTFEIDKSDLPF